MPRPLPVTYPRSGPALRRHYAGRVFARGPWKWTTTEASHFGYRDIKNATEGLHPQQLITPCCSRITGYAYGWEDNGTKFVVSVRDPYAPRRAEAR
jgi:hypothetical protein